MAGDKKQAKSTTSAKIHKKYEISGESIKRKGKLCPKCGAGVFLAEHKDRVSCGKCSYTEFLKK